MQEDDRKRKQVEAARERCEKCKLENIILNLEKVSNVVTKPVESNKEKVHKRKYAEITCDKYQQYKLIREQRAHKDQLKQLIAEPPPKPFASIMSGDREFSTHFPEN